MSTHNKGFYEEMTTIIFQLSLRTLSLPLQIILVIIQCQGYTDLLCRGSVADQCLETRIPAK